MIEYKVKVYASGDKHWYINGKRHREDGPAIKSASGHKYWWVNGERHRKDGPAVENANGNNWWFINGKEINEDEFNARTKSCDGKVVEIDGKNYKLVLESQRTLSAWFTKHVKTILKYFDWR